MEIEGEDGSKFALKSNSKVVFGRGHGFQTDDKTVSRNHLLFYFRSQTDPRVLCQVLGKNPVWVRSRSGGEIRVFRSSEKAELVGGDEFCVSGKIPVWFTLKKLEFHEDEQEKEQESAENLRSIDVSGIDIVKEFGFLVMGHEFDCYPKQRILHMKDWDWFLEEHEQGSDDDDDDDNFSEKKKRGMGRKRKKVKEKNNGGDDDWTDGSEDDQELTKKVRKVAKPKYSTRSKDTKDNSTSRQKYTSSVGLDEDEDDETLGGFIVNDEDLNHEGDEDEEEEFVEDDEEEDFVEDEVDEEEEEEEEMDD